MSDRRKAAAMTAQAPVAPLSDEALMARVAAADRDAFAMLVERHVARHVALAGRILGAAGDAEDVVQDAFLSVWRQARGYDSTRAAFATWLYRIVVNRCLDAKRKRKGTMLPLALAAAAVDQGPRPDQAAAGRSDAAAVRAALDALPPRQRAALVLVYYEGLSNREAAKVLDVGVKGLESLLVRARQRLRETLAPLADDLNGNWD
ncbi:MAG: RNA polymerase sigma factor [Alphaproteobacteria bacterium]|nr:MAG: RNA polymerase sigma factor [Alphaproteobacteria bacterium]